MKALTLALMIGIAALPALAADAPATDAIVKTYGGIALAAYSDALTQAEVLDKAVDALIANPTDDTLRAARVAREASRVPYQQTEAFRFGNPVVDDWGELLGFAGSSAPAQRFGFQFDEHLRIPKS